VYVAVGLAAVLFSSSAPGMVFSALLVAVSLDILRRRRSYRSHEREQYRKYARPH
jgi:amino acid transporter